jgi:hypothetical protein
MERQDRRPSRIVIADEGPDDTPRQIRREDVADPDVCRLEEEFAPIGHTELFVINDGDADRRQPDNTGEIDPVEPPSRRVPYSVGLEAWSRHLPETP